MTSSRRFLDEAPAADLPAWVHPDWRERLPWLVQGTTGRGAPDAPFDLGFFGTASPAGTVSGHWERLRASVGFERVVHGRQVHGAAVRVHRSGPAGLHLTDPCDGHATQAPGVLLAVTVADCVPVFCVDVRRRSVALLHAGWRGAAGGVLEAGLDALTGRLGSRLDDVEVHLGPSICGRCYEVGPEVFGALGLEVPPGPTPLDLRGALADRAARAGVGGSRVTVSTRCTRCGDGHFSHRGGDGERQVGYLGVRP